MKANELMIGDWIIIDDVPTKVVSIYEHSYHYRVNDDTNYVDNCKPIPLTDEILKANGWVQCKHDTCSGLYEYKGNHLRHAMIKRSGGRWVANVDDVGKKPDQYGFDRSYLRINIYFVHELQHALRLCGLNDLADNFKLKEE